MVLAARAGASQVTSSISVSPGRLVILAIDRASGTDHSSPRRLEGVRDAAVLAIERLRRDRGLCWEEIFGLW